MRLAILESNHWHTPLYLDAIARSTSEVVAVSDSTAKTGESIAKRFGCACYVSHADLLAREKIDFAFVFGRHVDMPAIARTLIERHIPFAIEKPCGIDAKDVDALATAATNAELYVSIPLIFRLHDMTGVVLRREAGAEGGIDHASFRFLGGPPHRYESAGTPWMLDPALAGGGPLMNVGIHFVDLFWMLARQDITSVSASSTNRIHGLAIEDYIAVTMRTAAGQTGVLECSYSFPSDGQKQRELTLSIRSPRGVYLSEGEGVFVRSMDGRTVVEQARMDADIYYADFVKRSLSEVRGGKKPFAGLADAARALRVVNAAYRSAGLGGMPIDIRYGNDAGELRHAVR